MDPYRKGLPFCYESERLLLHSGGGVLLRLLKVSFIPYLFLLYSTALLDQPMRMGFWRRQTLSSFHLPASQYTFAVLIYYPNTSLLNTWLYIYRLYMKLVDSICLCGLGIFLSCCDNTVVIMTMSFRRWGFWTYKLIAQHCFTPTITCQIQWVLPNHPVLPF